MVINFAMDESTKHDPSFVDHIDALFRDGWFIEFKWSR